MHYGYASKYASARHSCGLDSVYIKVGILNSGAKIVVINDRCLGVKVSNSIS